MSINQRWEALRDRAGMYLSPEARHEFTCRLTTWNELRRRRTPGMEAACRGLEEWLKLHLDWWENLWGDERQALAQLNLKEMGIDPRAPVNRQKREVHTYFSRRTFPSEAESQMTQMKTDQDADLVCRQIFTFLGNPPYYLGPSIDWNADPFCDIEWPTSLHRHLSWAILSKAYCDTRRERYVKAWVSQLVDWVSRNPIRPWSYRFFAWSTLNAAARAIIWGSLVPAMIKSPSFTPGILLLFLSALRRNMNFLMEHAAGGGNWLLFESEGLVRIGVCFPEFKQASNWRREGYRRLDREIRRQVLPDGAHVEFCPNYHSGILNSFITPLILARQCGFAAPFNAAYLERLRQTYRFFAFTAKPDGMMLPVGDSSRPINTRPLIIRGVREFDDPTLLFAATGGKEGRAPDEPCMIFRNSGHAIMRDFWQDTKRFLFFDVAPYGGCHSHLDSLQIILWAFGQDLLVDSGCYGYFASAHEEYGKTWRHNTVTVDEQSQDTTPHPLLVGWKTGESFSSAADLSRQRRCAVHANHGDNFTYAAGLSRQWPGVKHLREVIFVNATFWLVLDLLVSDQPHAFQQWWHFGQPHATLGRDNQCRTANLLLISAGAENICLQKAEIAQYNKKQFRPALCVKQRGQGLISFATLLYPHPRGKVPTASFVAFEPPSDPEGRFQVSVKTPLGKTTVVCSGPWGQSQQEPIANGWNMPLRGLSGGQYMFSYGNKCPSRSDLLCLRQDHSGKASVNASLTLDTNDHLPTRIEVEGLDNDKKEIALMEILVNGKPIYKGKVPFLKNEWKWSSFEIPAGLLVKGNNTVELKNMTPDKGGGITAGWYIVSGLKFTYEK